MTARVLIVEDDNSIREMVALALQDAGYDVRDARDGELAFELLKGAPADLLLVDLRMPLMDGFEFLQELRNLKGRTHQPVIALSGLASRADHQRIKAAGFAGHIDKPFDDVRLLAAIDDAIARRSPTA